MIIFHLEPLTFQDVALEPAVRAGLSVGAERDSHNRQSSTDASSLPYETGDLSTREKTCYFLGDLHAGLRLFH